MFLFKLNPVGFYLLLVQQVFYVYCQFHMLLYYYVIWISKLYKYRTHTEHSLEGTRGAGNDVVRVELFRHYRYV